MNLQTIISAIKTLEAKRFFYPSLILFGCFFTFLNQLIYDYVPSGDSLRYIALAEQYTDRVFFDPATNCYGHQFYAFFLAFAAGLFSYNHFVIGFVQSFAFGLTAVFLIKELEVYSGKNMGLVALIFFLVPECHIFNGYLLTESLATSILMAVFAFAVRIHNGKDSNWILFIFSSLLTMAFLTRIELTVCLIPLFYFLFRSIKSQPILFISAFLFPLIFTLTLCGVVNQKIYGVFKVTGFNGGEVIFGGNNLNGDISHHGFDRYPEIFIPSDKQDELTKIQALSTKNRVPALDRFYFSLAVDAWKKDPGSQVSAIPFKLARNWSLPGFFDIYTADTTRSRTLLLNRLMDASNFNNVWYAPYKHLFYMVLHWLLLAAVLIGIIKMAFQDRFQRAIFIFVVLNLLLAIPFSGLPRWHVTALPLLIIAFIPLAGGKGKTAAMADK